MSYLPKDCGKCANVVRDKIGFYCKSREKYIFNYQILKEYIVEPLEPVSFSDTEKHGGTVLNAPENDQWYDNDGNYDGDCGFRPNVWYNESDYYEPLEDGMGCLRR